MNAHMLMHMNMQPHSGMAKAYAQGCAQHTVVAGVLSTCPSHCYQDGCALDTHCDLWSFGVAGGENGERAGKRGNTFHIGNNVLALGGSGAVGAFQTSLGGVRGLRTSVLEQPGRLAGLNNVGSLGQGSHNVH